MAGQRARYTQEHDDADRTTLAVALVLIGLLVSGLALAHRQTITHGSAPGDACPTTAHGGIIGLDAETGAVRWTNVVPDGGHLRTDDDGTVHLERPASDPEDVDASVVVDRVVEPGSGRIASCSAFRSRLSEAARNARLTDPLEPPLRIGDVTVAKWADGIRATDATNTGIWSRRGIRAHQQIGDDLIVGAFDQAGGWAHTSRIDARTGEQPWIADGDPVGVGPSADAVLVRRADHPGQLTALDAETGKERWTATVPFDAVELASTDGVGEAFHLGSLVIVPIGDDGRVAALDAGTGRIRWTATAGTPGRNRRFSEPGRVSSAARSADGRTVIVAVDAWLGEQYD